MPKKPRGRPSSLTPKLVETIARFVGMGAHVDEAARAAGVGRSTLQGWLSKGAITPGTIERQLVEAVDEAQGKHAVRCHQTIARDAKRNAKTAVESLKLVNASRYAASRVEFQISSQLQLGLEALKSEFAHEPSILERILACLAGVPGGSGVEGLPFGAGAGSGPSPSDLEGSADPASADGSTVGIPRPLM